VNALRFEHTVFKKLSMSERKGFAQRIGYHNLYDEVTASNYYELDLSSPQMRQEIQRLSFSCTVLLHILIFVFLCVLLPLTRAVVSGGSWASLRVWRL
jgi:hypothetical protein